MSWKAGRDIRFAAIVVVGSIVVGGLALTLKGPFWRRKRCHSELFRRALFCLRDHADDPYRFTSENISMNSQLSPIS